MLSDSDDASLVLATLRGEETAYDELARRYRKMAFGTAFSRLGDYDAAQDVAQEALVTAYTQLPVLREPGRFAGWLCRMTSNLALLRCRRNRPTQSLDSMGLDDVPSAAMDPATAAAHSEDADALRDALSRLPDVDRLAVILHYMSGYTHEEIARILDVSTSSVKTRLFRARRRLRKELFDTMRDVGERLPEVEVTEEYLESILQRFECGEFGTVAHLGGVPAGLPGMPQYTEKTKDAIRRIADRLRHEGCRRLYAPPHIPDGSPALPVLRSLGFETEKEMLWYERDLTTRLSSGPPLPAGFDLRPLMQAPVQEVRALFQEVLEIIMRSNREEWDRIRRNLPEGEGPPWVISEEGLRWRLQISQNVREASVAAYRGDRLVAAVLASGITQWENWKYEPGTGVLWPQWNTETTPDSVIAHLIAASLRGLKKARLRRAVSSCMDPELGYDQLLIPVLESLGFRYIRSQWNLRLELQGGQQH